jgi:hypothetical protein
MERIQKDYGALIMSEGHIYDIEGEMSDNGCIFKDSGAFESGEGICYVGEYELEEIEMNLAELEAVYENTQPGEEGYLTDEEYRAERERIILAGGETRQTIIDQVWDAFGEDYMFTKEQLDYFAQDVFELADWACIATYLAENFEIEDCIEFDDIKSGGVFNKFQYEAVMAGMTPKEYAESKGLKPLNMQE